MREEKVKERRVKDILYKYVGRYRLRKPKPEHSLCNQVQGQHLLRMMGEMVGRSPRGNIKPWNGKVDQG